MTQDYPSFEDAEDGEFVGPNQIKSGDGFKVPMNRMRIHSETDDRMIQHLHRTAEEYGLDHEDAAAIYNEVNGFLADDHRVDEEQFEADITAALEEYSEGASAESVVEQYDLDEPAKEPYEGIDEIL